MTRSTTPRVAVYNRYWPSRGGGERFTGMAAQVLSQAGAEVDLVGHTEIDLDELATYLGLDLSGCNFRIVPDMGEAAFSLVTAEYDLLVNGSYMSRLHSQAKRSLYFCYFPTPPDHDLAPWQRRALRLFGRVAKQGSGAVFFDWGTGWFPPEGGRRRKWTWTNGDARLTIAPGDPIRLRLDLARVGSEPTELTVTADDQVVLRETAGPQFRTTSLVVPPSTTTRTVRFRSDTFIPGIDDQRQLGVAVSRMYFSGRGIRMRERLGFRLPWLLRDPNNLDYLDTYDSIQGVSQYTADWIDTLWAHPAEVLYPPIQVDRFHPQEQRERTIVAAGRFFAPGAGHSKRQLELVQTFGDLVRSGQLTDWTLHLVGGCEPRQQAYLDRVQAAAMGLPVHIHANAPRDVLESLMNSASIQWSATGYAEDETRAPWASEHFGMTTVEAMAGGCVPIVIDKAGQREIVRNGVDGFRWSTLDELSRRTVEVAADETLRARLAASARERAQQYSDEAFAARLIDLVHRHHLLGD